MKKLTKAQVKKIKAHIAKGKKSQREIAKLVGCSRSAVYYYVHK